MNPPPLHYYWGKAMLGSADPSLTTEFFLGSVAKWWNVPLHSWNTHWGGTFQPAILNMGKTLLTNSVQSRSACSLKFVMRAVIKHHVWLLGETHVSGIMKMREEGENELFNFRSFYSFSQSQPWRVPVLHFSIVWFICLVENNTKERCRLLKGGTLWPNNAFLFRHLATGSRPIMNCPKMPNSSLLSHTGYTWERKGADSMRKERMWQLMK